MDNGMGKLSLVGGTKGDSLHVLLRYFNEWILHLSLPHLESKNIKNKLYQGIEILSS